MTLLDMLQRVAERQAAMSDLQKALHRCLELGLDFADCAAVQPRGEATGAAGTILHPAAASPSLAQRVQTGAARECACCGEPYQSDPRVGDRARYCPDHRLATSRRRFTREQAERANGESRDPMETIRGWSHGPTAT